MQSPPPFARVEQTPATIAAGIRQQLDRECASGRFAPCPSDELDRVAKQRVEDLWEHSRIKTYVAVLALRQTREWLRARNESV